MLSTHIEGADIKTVCAFYPVGDGYETLNRAGYSEDAVRKRSSTPPQLHHCQPLPNKVDG